MTTKDIAAIVGGVIIGAAATGASYAIGRRRGCHEGIILGYRAMAYDPPMMPAGMLDGDEPLERLRAAA